MKKLQNLILNNTKYTVLLDQLIFSGNSFLTTLLMARILGLADFGIYSAVILFVYLILSILNAIIIQPLQVTLAHIEDKTYVPFTFWMQLALVLVVSLMLLILLQLNLSVLIPYNNLIFGITTLTAGFALHDYFRKVFLAQAALKKALVIDFLMVFFQLSIVTTALFFSKFTLSEIMTYLGLGFTPSIVLGVLFIRPQFSKITKWKHYISIHYQQAKWLLMTALVQWWSGNLFVVASGIFLGFKALGAFRLVQSLFGILNALLQTFENYALPQVARLLVTSQKQAETYIKQLGFKSIVSIGSLLLFTFIFSEPIIILAGGKEFAPYSYVVKGMTVLYLFIFIGCPIRMAIRALLLNKNFFFGYVFSLIFSLISFRYLLEKWNLLGAIAGLVISQLIVLGYWQYILMKNNFSVWK